MGQRGLLFGTLSGIKLSANRHSSGYPSTSLYIYLSMSDAAVGSHQDKSVQVKLVLLGEVPLWLSDQHRMLVRPQRALAIFGTPSFVMMWLIPRTF